jgi:hypothetical protein
MSGPSASFEAHLDVAAMTPRAYLLFFGTPKPNTLATAIAAALHTRP